MRIAAYIPTRLAKGLQLFAIADFTSLVFRTMPSPSAVAPISRKWQRTANQHGRVYEDLLAASPTRPIALTTGLCNNLVIYVEALGITMSAAQIELLKGTLDMLVLKVVALGPSHGYAIAQRLQQISRDFFQVHQGSLYPALHRLEDRGWLQAEWKESETGREAKFYSLTKKGRRQMKEEARNWERVCDAVALVLNASEKES